MTEKYYDDGTIDADVTPTIPLIVGIIILLIFCIFQTSIIEKLEKKTQKLETEIQQLKAKK